MRFFIIFTILLTNLFPAQSPTKEQVDKFVAEVKESDFAEIHEGFLDTIPYSFSIERNSDGEIVGIIESVGKRKISRNEFFYQNGKLIFAKKYIFNRKKNLTKQKCLIYPTLNFQSEGKCKSEELIKHGIWIYINNENPPK